MLKRRLFPALVILFLFLFPLSVQVAQAAHCPPNDPSRADCKAAANSSANPVVAVGAAVAGAAVATRRRGKTEEDEEEEEEEEEQGGTPCMGELERLLVARAMREGITSSIERLRASHQQLNQTYEIIRFKTMMGAGIDTAFIGQSLMGSSYKGSAISSVLFAGLKGILKEELKQGINGIVIGDQPLDLERFATKGGEKVAKKAALTAFQAALNRRLTSAFTNYAANAANLEGMAELMQGVSGGTGQQWVVEQFKRNWVRDTSAQWSKALTKFVDVGISIYQAADSAQKGQQMLDALKELLTQTQRHIWSLEEQFDTVAQPAAMEALSKLQGCLQVWIDSHWPNWEQRWIDHFGEASLRAIQKTNIGGHLAPSGMRPRRPKRRRLGRWY